MTKTVPMADKGLEKHSTISVASSILTCNGLKGSPPGCTCQSEMQECPVPLPSWWPRSTNNPARQWGEHLQWTSLYFLHRKQLCWGCCLTTLAMPTNHELTTHVADKETLLNNCHYTLEGKTEKPWGQHLLQIVLSTVWVKTRKKRWKRIIRPWKYKKYMSEALHL